MDKDELMAMFAAPQLAAAAEINTFGRKRWQTSPGKHLSTEERVKLSFEYAELQHSEGGARKASGLVQVALCRVEHALQHTAASCHLPSGHTATHRRVSLGNGV